MDSCNKQTAMDAARMAFVAERLASGQKVRYLSFRGVSMLPMLRQGKDSVELSPLPPKLKKFDLPVYRRTDGQYVMHRVVAVKEDHYICLGDNTLTLEHISEDQMIGIVSAFKRGDRRIEISNLFYGIYCRLWYLTYPIRKLIPRLKGCVRRVRHLLQKG